MGDVTDPLVVDDHCADCGKSEPECVCEDLVEVPLVAYRAALALLCDLEREAEGDRCPCCNLTLEDGATVRTHESGCPVGRAATVWQALDYSDPARQAAAVERLEQQREGCSHGDDCPIGRAPLEAP